MEAPFPAYQGEDDYFFVCYAHDDTKAVMPELERLRDLGFNIWYDEGISLGHEWTEEIATAISGATEFLYFVSTASVNSRNCRNEVQFAASRNSKIIAVHIEPTELPGGLELAIGLSQGIRRYEVSDDTFIKKLNADLTAPKSGVRPETAANKVYRGNLKHLVTSLTVRVLVASLVVFWWMQNRETNRTNIPPEPAVSADIPSVAVLPFDNLSSDPEQTYFAMG